MRTRSAESLDDCFAHDTDRLSHATVIDLITGNTNAIVGTISIPLESTTGRYAAAEIRAGRSVPGHHNAAVDGYAIIHCGAESGEKTAYNLVNRIAAGDVTAHELKLGEAARIFTGAHLPKGANTVVMQEDAETLPNGTVSLPSAIKPGTNIRCAGEDVGENDILIRPGDRLRPQDIAALASTGKSEIPVFETLTIGILSSGDEVRRPGTTLGEADVYDANSYLLRALAATLPVEVIDLGIVVDQRAAVEDRLADAARKCHLIITSGGASRGEEDHLVHVLAESGALDAWQIAIKPGRPLGLGSYAGTRVLMLPGNPVAVMVCFLLYAMPLIVGLGGGTYHQPRRFQLRAAFEIPSKKPDRREFLRGQLTNNDGQFAVAKYPRDGSGLISSLRSADGLIELAESIRKIDRGDKVAFIPFTEFGLFAG